MPDPTVPPTANLPFASVPMPTMASPSVKVIRFAIEIAGERNQNVMCPIDSTVARGRWERKNLAGATYDPEFAMMPDIPGMCFVVNSAKKYVRRFDPLAQPQAKRHLEKIKAVTQAVFKTRNEPEKERRWDDCDEDFLKTFCYWVMGLVDQGLAQLIPNSGAIPSFSEIKAMPGCVCLHPYDSSAEIDKRIPNDRLKYRPATKEEKEWRSEDEELEPLKIHFGMEGRYLDDGEDLDSTI